MEWEEEGHRGLPALPVPKVTKEIRVTKGILLSVRPAPREIQVRGWRKGSPESKP
jgi:hypothetical protein